MSSGNSKTVAGFFDRHSGVLCIIIGTLLLMYTAGMIVTWYAYTFGNENLLNWGISLIGLPTEFAIFAAFASRSRGFAFRRMRVKTHPMWLLLNEIFKNITYIDLMFASIIALISTAEVFLPTAKPGLFTLDKAALT